MKRRQLEIDFATPVPLRSPIHRPGRITRARWWFERMRQTVDQAWDWNSGPPGRPEQIRLELASPHGKN